MTDPEVDIRKAKQAAILLDDPLLKEAFEALERVETKALISCPPDELIERRANVTSIIRLRETLAQYSLDAENAEKAGQ
jgi:hypothetical protein